MIDGAVEKCISSRVSSIVNSLAQFQGVVIDQLKGISDKQNSLETTVNDIKA